MNFFIVSQNTACALPFIQRSTMQERRDPSRPGQSMVSLSLLRRVTCTLGYLLRSEVLHRCEQAISLGLAPKVLKLAFNMTYVGDVTIAPSSLEVCSKLLFTRNQEAQRELVLLGERRTWPCIPQIRGQCEVEMVLDQCVRHLSAQVQRKAQRQASRCNTVVFSPQFRQQRHTHLDLNQYFTSSAHGPSALCTSMSFPRSNSASSGRLERGNSGGNLAPLLPLPPIHACPPAAAHRSLPSFEGSMEMHDDHQQPSPPLSHSGEGEEGEDWEHDLNPREECSMEGGSGGGESRDVKRFT